MLWEMKTAMMDLLWGAALTTKLYSWVLVLSLSYLLGQLFGSGIQAIIELKNPPPIASTVSKRDLPSWKQDTSATDLKSSTLNRR